MSGKAKKPAGRQGGGARGRVRTLTWKRQVDPSLLQRPVYRQLSASGRAGAMIAGVWWSTKDDG